MASIELYDASQEVWVMGGQRVLEVRFLFLVLLNYPLLPLFFLINFYKLYSNNNIYEKI